MIKWDKTKNGVFCITYFKIISQIRFEPYLTRDYIGTFGGGDRIS